MGKDKRMKRSCRDIENAYLHLLAEKEFEDITIEEILAYAGYSKTAFYNNYSNKFDLSASIALRLSNDLTIAIGDALEASGLKIPSYQEGQEALINIYRAVYKYKDIYTIYYKQFGIRALDYIFQTCLSGQRLSEACAKGAVDSRINIELYRHAHIWDTLGCVIYWIKNDFSHTPEYMGEQHYLRFAAIRRPE